MSPKDCFVGVDLQPSVFHISSVHDPLDKRIFVRQARVLAKRGWLVTIIAPQGGSRSESVFDGVRLIKLPKPHSRKQRITITLWLLLIEVLRGKPQIVHFHDPEILLLAPWIRLLTSARLVYDVHEDLPKQILGKYWIPVQVRPWISLAAKMFETHFFALFLHAVVGATQAIADRFSVKHRIRFLNLPDPAIFVARASDNATESRVVYAGGLAPIRGLTTMLDLATDLARNQIQLTLVGTFESERVRQDAESHSGWKYVDFRGWLDISELVQLYHTCRAGLIFLQPIPNYIEAEPVKLLEYLSCGLPVIAGAGHNWNRHIEDSKAGYVVAQDDKEAQLAAIIAICSQDSKFQQLSQNAINYSRKNFNFDQEIESLEALYRQLVHS